MKIALWRLVDGKKQSISREEAERVNGIALNFKCVADYALEINDMLLYLNIWMILDGERPVVENYYIDVRC